MSNETIKLLAALSGSAILLAGMSACRSTSVSRGPRPSPTPKISAGPAQPIEFIAAVSQGTVEYTLQAKGSFNRVVLWLTNKSETPLQVSVEVGTEFEPAQIDMPLVVFKKASVLVQPRQRWFLELEVTSLDIHKPPSLNVGTAWQVHKSNRLTEFLQCASDTLEKKKKSNEAYEQILGGLESFMLQYSVWRARGAGREDFMDHWVKEEGNSQSQAEVDYAAFYPVLEEIKRACGELKKL
jgi:hypothetical protein